MPIKIIGKSVLGELGFCMVPSKMQDSFESQLNKIEHALPWPYKKTFMTSITNSKEVVLTDGLYFPKIRKIYSIENASMFDPRSIYHYCKIGEDIFRPSCDFIVCNDYHAISTFSREAPIIAFESEKGKAIGTISRASLMKYGNFLFSSMKKELGNNILVTLVTCNHYDYLEGSIPSIFKAFALKYGMHCVVGVDSEKHPECYHRGENGNHVVTLW